MDHSVHYADDLVKPNIVLIMCYTTSGYMPSILCYKETGPDSWVEHFCLVKPDAIFDDEGIASQTAEKHLAEARALVDAGGSIQDFALSLRHQGYKNISDFRIVKDGRRL